MSLLLSFPFNPACRTVFSSLILFVLFLLERTAAYRSIYVISLPAEREFIYFRGWGGVGGGGGVAGRHLFQAFVPPF